MEKYPLNPTDSPIDYNERLLMNENWTRITSYFNHLQEQLKILARGQELDEILSRIETAITDAQHATISANEAVETIRAELAKIATAISNANTASTNANKAATAANTAKQHADAATVKANHAASAANQAKQHADAATANAIEATTNANNAASAAHTATKQAEQATRDAITAATNTNSAIQEATTATSQALQAVQDVRDAIAAMHTAIDTYKNSFEHKADYQKETQYVKNNEVLYFGSTFRAKQDTLGNPPPATYTSNAYWQLIARRGEDAPVDKFSVWRGATPPTNTRLLWWYDPTFVAGEEVYIYCGEIPPTDTNHLWLAPRGI